MANIRVLKKEIDQEIFQVISDCFTFSALHPDEKSEDLSVIISDACTLRNDLIHRVNNREDASDSKAVRVHYQGIRKDLETGVDKLFEQLSSLMKKKKK
jgi:hypothetical protein